MDIYVGMLDVIILDKDVAIRTNIFAFLFSGHNIISLNVINKHV